MVVLLVLFSLNAQGAITLQEAFDASKKNNPTYKQIQTELEIADINVSKSWASALPIVSLNDEHAFRDEVGGGGVAGRFGEGYQRTSYFRLEQPIFQGLAEVHGIQLAKILRRQSEFRMQTQEYLLFSEVARVFYQLKFYVKQRQLIKEQIKILKRLESVVRKRAGIGRSQQTELLATQTQVARAKADFVQMESNITSARNEFFRTTGLRVTEELSDKLLSERLSASRYKKVTIEELPTYQEKKLALEQSQKELSIVKSEYWPEANLNGNYYFERAGILEESKWDMNINLRWELFSGGSTRADQKIANLQLQLVDFELTRLKLDLESSYRAALEQVVTRESMVNELKKARILANKNYNRHRADYSKGLVSFIEVLRAQDDHNAIERSYNQSVYDLQVAWAQLLQITGRTL